ncbi:MAG: AhpC/TSA family protein [Bacteroidetes bacterium]|nr:AhpC/TSA family protein [Bacteroidota bacterium]
MLRFIFVGLFLSAVFGTMAFIFWKEEIRYSLPTPVPANYESVQVGAPINRSDLGLPSSSLYLHFYNPDCPCSRFNAQHIRQLIRSHGDSVAAFIIVPKPEDLVAARKEFGEALDFRVDTNGALSRACGVYSTPQAVVIDQDGKLFFRGNYNRARYCTARATNYAELALLSLINGSNPPVFDLFATQSYGCSLPGTNTSSASLFIQ